MASTIAARRAGALARFADDLLDQRAETESEIEALKAAEREARAIQAEKARRRAELTAERDRALGEAEETCRELVKRLFAVRELSRALGQPLPGVMRQLSDLISAELRPLSRIGGDLGNIRLSRTWRRPGQPWTDRTLPGFNTMENEKDDDTDRDDADHAGTTPSHSDDGSADQPGPSEG